MWLSSFHMFNISFIACIKEVHWSWESRRPDSVWAGVDNRFCTHDLIKENTWMIIHVPKKSWLHYMHWFVLALHTLICSCITCINSFMAYHKNDFEILTITMVCSVSKSDHQIERYRIINFARSACIVYR